MRRARNLTEIPQPPPVSSPPATRRPRNRRNQKGCKSSTSLLACRSPKPFPSCIRDFGSLSSEVALSKRGPDRFRKTFPITRLLYESYQLLTFSRRGFFSSSYSSTRNLA